MQYVYDLDEIKERLTIPYAASRIGILFGDDHRALCPFHDDRVHPNLELMPYDETDHPWWYCRACGAWGDVVELVRRVQQTNFNSALLVCSQMLDEQPPGFQPPAILKQQVWEVTPEWETRLIECQQRAIDNAGVGLLSYAYGFTEEADDLATRQGWDAHLINWGWGLDDHCNIVIPHRDTEGELTAVKVKYRNGKWRAFGHFPTLYGAWRDVIAAPTLLCEGESDTVWAAAQGLDLLVRGIPSGANWIPNSDVIDGITDQVFLAFDNDGGGNAAKERWLHFFEHCGWPIEVKVVPLPEGQDLRETGRTVQLADLLRAAV